MSDFSEYMKAKAERQTADANYNYASAKLKNAQIKERLAEIKSQCEPLDSLMKRDLLERDRLYASACYVVFGRMPENVLELETEDEK